MTNTNVRAALYARFSSHNQREESIDAQIRAMTKYCEDNKFTIVKTYADSAQTGTNCKRDEFTKMMSDAENDIFDVIVVHKLDRFSRNLNDSVLFTMELKKHGIELLSVTENLDDTAEGVLMKTVVQGMNEYYSRNLSRETMKGLMENAHHCMWTGGKPPLGYDVVDKKLVVNQHEAEAVRLIFNMANDGYGYTAIINKLNSLGYLTKRGKPFGKNSLHEILMNERYKGVFVFNKRHGGVFRKARNNHEFRDDEQIIRIENGCPQLVTPEVWQSVNKVRLALRKKASNRKYPYLLSGLIYCKCGAKFHGNIRKIPSSGKVYTTYRCSNRANTNQCDCVEIKCSSLDGYVLDEFFKYFFSENSISKITLALNERLKEQCDNNEDYKYSAKELERCKLYRTNLLDTIQYTGVTAEIAQRLKACEEQIKEHQAAVDRFEGMFAKSEITEDEVRENLSKLREYMENPDNFNNVRYVLSQYIERIDVDNENVSVTFKAAMQSKNGDITLNGTVSSDRKAFNEQYKFVEHHTELCERLDKIYELHKQE